MKDLEPSNAERRKYADCSVERHEALGERREQITRLLVEHERDGGSLAALLAASVGDAMDQLRWQPST